MDLQILVFLLFVLFTAGHSLRCYECLDLKGSCANQNVTTCTSGFSNCMSLTTVVVTQAGEISSKVKIKDCAAVCTNGSMNFGIAKTSSVCCNTDRCNIQDAPDLSTSVPNGKKCYSCDDKSCSNILSCTGSEERCFTATESFGGQSLVLKGCVSKSICGAETSVRDIQGVSCCEGNLCNGVNSITQSSTQSASGANSITQSSTQSASGAISITQSFLFLCCSLLCFILLH